MPKSTPQIRKQKVIAEFRRGEILAAATKLFASKGYHAATMDELAKSAQLAKGTLYLYFDSKDAVYQAVVEQALDKLAALTEEHVQEAADFVGKLSAFIAVRISFWNEQQQLYRIILSINREGAHRKRSIAWQKQAVHYLEGLILAGVQTGEIPEQDCRAAAWTTMDAIRGVNERRVFSEGRSTEDDTQFLTSFLLHALCAKKSQR